MTAEKMNNNDEIMHLWTELYLNQKMSALQKRIYDWWVGEGFFYASNFKETTNGTVAELMLLIGDSADNLVAENKLSKFAAEEKVEKRKEQGWELIPFGERHFFLKDTEKSRVEIQRLLEENIRFFSVLEFCAKEFENSMVLKSVIIEIKRRKEV